MNIFTKFKLTKKIDHFFSISKKKSTFRRELVGGTVTFFTMAYILVANPEILSKTGMNKNAVFTATVLSAIVATLIMALYAKLPFALAPGMGINVFFAFTVVGTKFGYTWQQALAIVFIAGIVFTLLTIFNIRKIIVDAVPLIIKQAIPIGIGLFIIFLGLQNSGLIVKHSDTFVTFGGITGETIITLIGVVVIGILLIWKVPGAIFIGIIVATIFSMLPHISEFQLKELEIIKTPPSISPIFFQFDFSKFFVDFKAIFLFLSVLFTFLFVDMFDTMGTFYAVASKGNLIDKNGNVHRMKQAFFADSCGTVVGATLGTSTVTTYVESAAGVAAGGRTGLTSLTVVFWMILSLFFSPIFLIIPKEAIAAALIVVGFYMIAEVNKMNFNNLGECIPAFFVIIMIPFTFAIDKGIMFGILFFVLLKLGSGKWRQVKLTTLILVFLIILRFFIIYINS